MVKVWKDNGCILHLPTGQAHLSSCQHSVSTQVDTDLGNGIFPRFAYAILSLQSQMREHKRVGFLVIQNIKIGNGHVTQYGFEFLLLYILFNLTKLQALCSS